MICLQFAILQTIHHFLFLHKRGKNNVVKLEDYRLEKMGNLNEE